MFKRHHKLILIVALVGILYLIYEWYKNRSGSSGSGSGTVDTTGYPTIISTGGGASMPSMPSYGVQSFDNQTSQPITPTSSPSSVPTMTVMPNASQSGVPSMSAAAQEFNTNQSIAAPSQAVSAPSFYTSVADLPYINVSQETRQVQPFGDPNATPTTRGTLLSFLQNDVLTYERDPNQNYLSVSDVQNRLVGEQAGYCGLPGNDCGGSSPIADLVSQYSDFLKAKDSLPTYGGSTNTPAPAQVSTPVTTPAPTSTVLPPSRLPGGGRASVSTQPTRGMGTLVM
jgi:hypothetical protein